MPRKSPHTPEQRKAIAVAKHLLDLGLRAATATLADFLEQAAGHVLADVGLSVKHKVTPVFESNLKPAAKE